MQIQRCIERLRGLEDRPEVGVVEIAVTRTPVEHGAVEPKFGDGSAEFGCRRVRIGGGQRCEPCRRSGRWRTASASLSLHTACNATASARSKSCSPGVVIDTTATVETGVVHRGDALGVDIQESAGELIIRRMDERNVLPLRLQCVPGVDQLGRREVFFQTNDLHAVDDKRVY